MATIIVLTNVSQATDILIKDVGISIPNSGGSETFDTDTDFGMVLKLQESDDLRAYLIDDAYGAGSSTLILNDGTSDIAQADAADFLDTVLLPDASNEFGVVKTNAVKEIDDNLDFDGTATLIDGKLGSALNADSFKITSLGTPTLAGDAATKQYVDDFAITHKTLLQLIHFIDNGPAEGFATGATRSTTGTNFPSQVLWRRADTTKLVEKNLTYTGAFPITIQWKIYDTDGSTVLATVTDTISYSGAYETSRSRAIA